ncbi:MAG: formylglycine-generating enzyme family protein [Rhodospirillaceae bacterium]|nr:formylglycine-generating enzyme family protein [Rhodospirillaceae bacterium]
MSFVASTAHPEPVTFKDCADCPAMVVVPAGSFVMGAGEAETAREGVPDQGNNERPVREVHIARPFAVGMHEVTLAQFKRFVAATGYAPERGCTVFIDRKFELQADKAWDNPGFRQGDDEPVLCVAWADAKAYADWLARETGQPYRLLTEAEWEYAARAGTTTARFWGDGLMQACAYANVADTDFMTWAGHPPDAPNRFPCADGFTHAAPVGSFRPNAFGLHDMLGNVLEWTADCHAPTHDAAPVNDAACFRVAKGGGWPNRSLSVRAAWRVGGGDHVRNDHLGFRVARDMPPSATESR